MPDINDQPSLDTEPDPDDYERRPCGETGCLCGGFGPEHAECACGCDCPRDDDGQRIDY